MLSGDIKSQLCSRLANWPNSAGVRLRGVHSVDGEVEVARSQLELEAH